MTTQQLITRVDNYLAYDLDGYFGTAPTDAQVVAALNDALLDVSDAAYLVKPDIALTLTESQYSYAFDSALAFPAATLPLKVLKVVVNGNVLKTMDGRRSGLWTMREVEDLRPGWRDDDDGVPTKAWVVADKLYLHPAPSAAVVSAGETYVAAQYRAAPLSESALVAEPDLPATLHESLAKVAAAKAAAPNVTEGHQDARVQRMLGEGMAKAVLYGREQMSLWNAPGSRKQQNRRRLCV